MAGKYSLGNDVGNMVGIGVGTADGTIVGTGVGTGLGTEVGTGLGTIVGTEVGTGVGIEVGTGVGNAVGTPEGAGLGTGVGAGLGTGVGTPMHPTLKSKGPSDSTVVPSTSIQYTPDCMASYCSVWQYPSHVEFASKIANASDGHLDHSDSRSVDASGYPLLHEEAEMDTSNVTYARYMSSAPGRCA